MKNLTKGKPLKVILLFAIPLYVGQLFQLCYSLIDTRIIGSALGEAFLAVDIEGFKCFREFMARSVCLHRNHYCGAYCNYPV